jgi:hypothetical protein
MQLGATPPAVGMEGQRPAGGAGLGGTQGSLPRALRRAGIPARHGQHRAPRPEARERAVCIRARLFSVVVENFRYQVAYPMMITRRRLSVVRPAREDRNLLAFTRRI